MLRLLMADVTPAPSQEDGTTASVAIATEAKPPAPSQEDGTLVLTSVRVRDRDNTRRQTMHYHKWEYWLDVIEEDEGDSDDSEDNPLQGRLDLTY